MWTFSWDWGDLSFTGLHKGSWQQVLCFTVGGLFGFVVLGMNLEALACANALLLSYIPTHHRELVRNIIIYRVAHDK